MEPKINAWYPFCSTSNIQTGVGEEGFSFPFVSKLLCQQVIRWAEGEVNVAANVIMCPEQFNLTAAAHESSMLLVPPYTASFCMHRSSPSATDPF